MIRPIQRIECRLDWIHGWLIVGEIGSFRVHNAEPCDAQPNSEPIAVIRDRAESQIDDRRRPPYDVIERVIAESERDMCLGIERNTALIEV